MSTPSKAQDPAAAALSAIEDALRLNVEPDAQSAHSDEADKGPTLEFHLPSSRAEHADVPAPSPRMPDIDLEELAPPPPPSRSRDIDSVRPFEPAARPANDDRPSVGQILQSLQTHPDSSATTVAIIGSATWAGLWLGYLGFTHAAAFTVSLFGPAAAISIFALIGPIIFFLSMGSMARRSQEMRLTARSMAEVAIRLAEPETLATEQVVTLSQAIRREVASMGDGIERALARASELETMVRAEVSSLERTYSDNERRIRLLLDELASERESIILNADRVSTALIHAQSSAAAELETATDRLTGLLGEAGDRIAQALEHKGGEIDASFAKSGDSMLRQLETRAEDLLERFQRSGDEAARAIELRGSQVDGELRAFTDNFIDKVNTRSDALTQHLESVGARIGDNIGRRGDDLHGRLVDQAERLHDIVVVQGPALSQALAALGEDLTLRLREESGQAQAILAASGDTFAQTLTAHRARTTEDFAAATRAAMLDMTGSAEALKTHVGETTNRAVEDFSQSVEAIGQTYASVSLQTVESVAGHADALRENFTAAAEETLAAFAGHTQAFNDQFARSAADAIDGIAGHTENLRTTVDEATQTTLAAIGEKTEMLRDQLDTISGSTLETLEQQAARIELAFRQNVDYLEKTVGSSTEETLAALVGHTNAFQEQFTLTAQHTIDAVTSQGERLEHMVAAATQDQLATLAGHTDSFQENFTRIASETTEQAEARAHKLREALEETSFVVAEALKQYLTNQA